MAEKRFAKLKKKEKKTQQIDARLDVCLVSVAAAERRHYEAATVYEPTAHRWLLVYPLSTYVSVKWAVGESLVN